MNTIERKAFWEKLTSTDCSDINEMRAQLSKVIKYPDYIYRFRPINSYSLDSLRTNRLYFSSADNYDDPFDSYVNVDLDGIISQVKDSLNNQEYIKRMIENAAMATGLSRDFMLTFLNSYDSRIWCEFAKYTINDIKSLLQKNSLSICFTEKEENEFNKKTDNDGLNEVLWLKYAENHHGFALEYDLSNDTAFLCGTIEPCVSCPASKISYPLYPVYYSNEKYDATEFVRYTLFLKSIENAPPTIKERLLMNSTFPNMSWQRERISLIKHKCHEYDREWRMIYPNNFDMSNMKERPFVCWKPSSVTIGFRTDDATKNLIMALAKEADIPQIYECYINNHNALDRKLIYEKP